MLQLLILLGALTLHPYWHVPRAAKDLKVVATVDNAYDLTCQTCGKVVYRWNSEPTLTDTVEAAKYHKKHRKQ